MASKDLLSKKLGDLLAGRKAPAGIDSVPDSKSSAESSPSAPKAAFNPFDLDSESQEQPAAQVSLGPQAQKMVDRVALVRQIEERLGIQHVQPIRLQQGGEQRNSDSLPDSWEGFEDRFQNRIPARANIPQLNMGSARLRGGAFDETEAPPVGATRVKSSPSAQAPNSKLSGLAADLHALEVLRRRAEEKLKVQAIQVDPVKKVAKVAAKSAGKVANELANELADKSAAKSKTPRKVQKSAAVESPAVKSPQAKSTKVASTVKAKAPAKTPAKASANSPTKVPAKVSSTVPIKSVPAELSEFLDTPAYLQMESRAQADLAGFFMDEFQLIGFKERILNERSKQTRLVPKYFKHQETVFDLQAQAKRPDLLHDASALYNEQDLNEWVDQLEKNFPPLYKQESRVERPEVSLRTLESLKSLPLIGRNVTVGSMLNSWKLMGNMGRVRSLVIQPDFLRLDQQETFEHEIFLGQTALPTHRNHTLFKAKDMEGYLSNTALHLYRPRQLLAPHEDAEGYFTRLHPVQKRGFGEQAFHGWFDKVFTTALSHVTLIESFVAEVVGRYTMVQRKLLKQAKAVSMALVQEMESSGTVLRQDAAFKMHFFQTHGFVPSDSFYEFLACPVRGLVSESGLPIPLWQALGQAASHGYDVQWKNIVLEEQPVDLVLLHFLALYAQSPDEYEGLIPTLGMLDLLVRCGDFLHTRQPSGSKKEQYEQEKSTALLKAYEHLLVEEELKSQPEANHKLGTHHIVWDKQTQSTVACSAYLTQQHANQLQEAFAGLRQTLEGTGLWRDEISDWAKLLGREFGLVH